MSSRKYTHFFDEIKENNIALIDSEGNVRTYKRLMEKALNYLSIVPKRSLVIILCDYSIETMEFYFSCLYNGVVPIMLDPASKASYIREIMEQYGVQYLFGKKKDVENYGEEQYAENAYGIIRVSDKQTALLDELAIILTTSGSTSNPKMVCLSVDNLAYNTEVMIQTYGLTEQDRGIITLPLQYAYGLTFVHMHWKIGASLILTNKSIVSTEFWRLYDQYLPTNMAGVPFTYELLERVGFLERDLGKLRFMSQSGGALPGNLKKKYILELAKKNVDLYVFLGLTEATGMVSYVPVPNNIQKINSVGIPAGDMKIQILDQELVLSGRSVCLGYAQSWMDLQSIGDSQQTWYTGDMAYVDEDGYIVLAGRRKRIAKILGNRINLEDIDELIVNTFSDVICACTCKEDSCIVANIQGTISDHDLKRCIIDNIQNIDESMIQIKRYDSLPRLSNGKIDFKELEKI